MPTFQKITTETLQSLQEINARFVGSPEGFLADVRHAHNIHEQNAIRAEQQAIRELLQEHLSATNPCRTLPEGTNHSPDFRSVSWFGACHCFTPNQAGAIQVLWKAWEQGTPDVGGATLIEAADASTERVDVLFRGNPAWGTIIVQGATKGSYRLAEPTADSPKPQKAKRESARARK